MSDAPFVVLNSLQLVNDDYREFELAANPFSLAQPYIVEQRSASNKRRKTRDDDNDDDDPNLRLARQHHDAIREPFAQALAFAQRHLTRLTSLTPLAAPSTSPPSNAQPSLNSRRPSSIVMLGALTLRAASIDQLWIENATDETLSLFVRKSRDAGADEFLIPARARLFNSELGDLHRLVTDELLPGEVPTSDRLAGRTRTDAKQFRRVAFLSQKCSAARSWSSSTRRGRIGRRDARSSTRRWRRTVRCGVV